MKRDSLTVLTLPDPVRDAVGLEAGHEGRYYVGGKDDDYWGTKKDNTILDHNYPPTGQPSLWCQWVPVDASTLEWDGGEKFYDYVEWIKYLIEHFLVRWGYSLTGIVEWTGEDRDDRGEIDIDDNFVVIREGRITYETIESWRPEERAI
jgi:hypothetical protein